MANSNSIISLVFLLLTCIFSIITIAMVSKGYQAIKNLENAINYMNILNLKDADIKGSAAGVLAVAIISAVISFVAFILTLFLTLKAGRTSPGKPKVWGVALLVISLLWLISLLAFSIIAGTRRFRVGQGSNYDSLLTGTGGSTMSNSSTLRSAIVIGSRSTSGEFEIEERQTEITDLFKRFVSSVPKRADDDDEDDDDVDDNDDDGDGDDDGDVESDSSDSDNYSSSSSSSSSSSTSTSSDATDDDLGSSIADSGVYSSGGGVSNMYSESMPKYIEVRSSKRIMGLGWIAFALSSIAGFLLLLLPLKSQNISKENSSRGSPEIVSREVSKDNLVV